MNLTAHERLVMVSSWTDGLYGAGDRGGVHVYRIAEPDGEWELVGTHDTNLNVGFLAFDPVRPAVYVLDERKDIVGGTGGGFATSYAIDPETGRLTREDTVSSVGPNPSYVSVDPKGRFVFVANHGNAHHAAVRVRWDDRTRTAAADMLYDDGTVAVLPVRSGGLGPVCHVEILAAEPGPDPTHQRGSHPHAALIDPTGRFLVVCDKGTDRIRTFRIHEDGRLGAAGGYWSAAGRAPRHPAFHPSNGLLYVVNELHSSIDVFALNTDDGSLEYRQSASTVPFRDPGDNHPSDIAFHPGGGYLYASNRGDDSVCVLAVDPADGTLEPLELVDAGGGRPRGITVDPDGRAVYVACTDSGVVAVHRIDLLTGKLLADRREIPVPRPTCIRFLPATRGSITTGDDL
ncbi:lactonase family protein [Nocardia miyunensis]|uniref:lactonase family protein n=1 Tax=Nocardia miyunensis TaxID=282684 RepID=UPI000837861C|nr:lactonase family protein [Nocardia miyunensis]